MSDPIKMIVGRTAETMAEDFIAAWKRAERGEAALPQRILSFESWEGLSAVMTGERYRLLRYLHGHPQPSISSLARALGRQYRRVHADVTALERVGLIERVDDEVRATADTIEAEIRL
jgi:predicted transcriptional regulator